MRLTPILARLAGPALLMLLPATATADQACRPETFEGARYTVCSFDPTRADLRMFWGNQAGKPYGSFSALAADLGRDGKVLSFAMNGGMYQADRTPVGLFVEDGEELRPVNTKSVTVKPEPNFYKKPNGVFFLGAGGAGVMTTEAFLDARPEVRFATQSGPMLVIDGKIHPAFIVNSSDRKPRNGVGVCSPTEVHFAIAEEPVNFHDFARLFRDRLGCPDALFLDGGSASGLHAPAIGRSDFAPWEGYGPIIGVVE